MQLKKFLCIMLALSFVFTLVMMFTSCNKTDGTKATDTTGETTTDGTTNTDSDSTTGTKGTTGSDEPEDTTTETEPHHTGKAIKVTYASNNFDAGSVWGKQTQTIYLGETKTSEVGAVANLGYKFVGWSDGVTTPERAGDSFSKDTTIFAVFEIDAYKMPVIQIDTENKQPVPSKDYYINAKISIGNTKPSYTINNLDTEIRGRGNFSWGLPKKSYRLKLSEKKNLLGQGDGPAKSWTLLAYHNDFTMLRGPMTFNFARLMDNIPFVTSVNLVELYFNGSYEGVYLLCEQMQVNEFRVDVNEELVQPDKGYLIELDNYAEGDSKWKDYIGSGGPYSFYAANRRYEIKSEVYSQAEIDFIQEYVERCMNAVKTGNRELIESLIDIPSVIDTYIVEELIKNLDAGWSSFYMHKPQGGKLYFGPIWDVDFAGGNSNAYGCENYEGLYVGVDVGAQQGHPWFITLMKYTWFREEVTKRWNDISDKLATIVPEITRMDSEFKDSLERNYVRWPIFGSDINRTPSAVRQLRDHTENVDYLKNWMENRIAWLTAEYNSESFKNGGVDVAELKVSGGKGTKAEPYLISKKADFISFANMLKFGHDFAGVYFKQTINLALSRDDYNGLGQNALFAGYYDGGGNTIAVNIQGTDNCVFPYVSGTIINVFTTGSITNTEQAAGIARSLRMGGAIINCGSTINITSPSGNSGGITASTEGVRDGEKVPVIANCYFAGSLSNIGGGPINPHSNGREVVTKFNYYLAGTGTKAVEGETSMTAAQMKSGLHTTLNNNRTEAAKLVAGLQTSDLCQWESSGGFPTMVRK